MVTDSSLDFGTSGFGLSEFVTIMTNSGQTVATAHRNGSDPNLTIAGNFNFTTAAAVTTANYDQIWLFAYNTTALSAPEQATIAQFMQSCGGVFATGDHETIGAEMGANLPRVRTMRNWSTIPMVNPTRHNTMLDPGTDNVKQFQDQADAIPQRIYPIFFSNGGPDNVASSWSVHPVLVICPVCGGLLARPSTRERVPLAHARCRKFCWRGRVARASRRRCAHSSANCCSFDFGGTLYHRYTEATSKTPLFRCYIRV